MDRNDILKIAAAAGRRIGEVWVLMDKDNLPITVCASKPELQDGERWNLFTVVGAPEPQGDDNECENCVHHPDFGDRLFTRKPQTMQEKNGLDTAGKGWHLGAATGGYYRYR